LQNNSKVLKEIISSQRPNLDKSGLGYNQTENGSSFKITCQEATQRQSEETRSFTRKITETLLHPEDSDFKISDSQKQEGLKKNKGSKE
jgi:hypothetical protein